LQGSGRKAVKGGDGAGVSEPELIVFTDGSKSRLAWKMLLSISLDAYWLVVIDAHTARCSPFITRSTRWSVNGSGRIFWEPPVLEAVAESGKYYLVDTSKAMYDATSDPQKSMPPKERLSSMT